MKRALVIYESMYGNTEQIARAIGEGLGDRMQVEVVEVGAAPTTLAADVGLVVVGGPTHAFSMSRRAPASRPPRRPSRLWYQAGSECASGSKDSSRQPSCRSPRHTTRTSITQGFCATSALPQRRSPSDWKSSA
jgi:hypothetical protein